MEIRTNQHFYVFVCKFSDCEAPHLEHIKIGMISKIQPLYTLLKQTIEKDSRTKLPQQVLI